MDVIEQIRSEDKELGSLYGAIMAFWTPQELADYMSTYHLSSKKKRITEARRLLKKLAGTDDVDAAIAKAEHSAIAR